MELAVLREDMVDSLEHDAKAVVNTDDVGLAMRTVPREAFVDDDRKAYADQSLEHHGTRVLSPSTAARLMEVLAPDPGDDVLVVGVGVGYTTAVAAEIAGARHVHAVDITRPIVHDARENLADAGYPEVLVDCRDGARGLPDYAPYDRILVEAAAVDPPAPLLDQLAPDGRLVIPRGRGASQTLVAVDADGTETTHGPVAFAPLLVDGEQTGALERNRTAREDAERAARAAQAETGWEHEWIDWE
ncbi:protein-L-isoaspartate O-methyltransferase [Halorubellus sp. JP-L1]|uniref:protein-L-isoaspartate O-methyltransferase family protein n=1 Tax=Halorubellus sp. JP-L1 TaxID=2715753 RepID=UPI0014082101|nr:protein-L-isoaspartate O-methyltransferase [Halorubellus sp. JP-L1]NHN41574.1 protein-L-isoaspartate O-methyltransferase [Halorubellus sp. JP-L1]